MLAADLAVALGKIRDKRALALNPRYVRVVSGNSEGSAVLELRPGRPDHYEAREEPAAVPISM